MKFQTECRNFSAPKMFKLRFSITITQWQPKPTRHHQHGSWCELVKRTRFLGNQKTAGKQHLTRNMPEEYKVRLCFREAGSSVEQCSKCFDVRNSNCAKSLLPFLIHFISKVSLVRCGKNRVNEKMTNINTRLGVFSVYGERHAGSSMCDMNALGQWRENLKSEGKR